LWVGELARAGCVDQVASGSDQEFCPLAVRSLLGRDLPRQQFSVRLATHLDALPGHRLVEDLQGFRVGLVDELEGNGGFRRLDVGRSVTGSFPKSA
jgi:hypothetical protein